MPVMKRLDYPIKQTSALEIGAILTNMVEKLNTKQNATSNKIGESDFKQAFYATVFDPRSKSEYYVFSDYVKGVLELSVGYVQLNSTTTSANGGVLIDDLNQAGDKTYSSQKIEALFVAKLAGVLKESELEAKLAQLGFVKKTELTTTMRYKGSVTNFEALPSADVALGDVYNLSDSGKNYAYDGSGWDEIGGGNIDTSTLVTKQEMAQALGDGVSVEEIRELSGQ